MKGRKEEKVKEIKGKGHSAIWREGKKKRVKSQSVRTKCSVSESKQKNREEKNKEGKRKYTVRKRVVSEKIKRVSLLKLYL